jgi:DNA-binding NarL/FixJ family response regulator
MPAGPEVSLDLSIREKPPNSKSSMTKKRIFIVDDHPLYREGLRRFIDSQPNLTCCFEADSYKTALDNLRQCRPDLVVLDLRLRGADGMELMKNLLAELPQLRILVLSQGDETVHAELVLRAGALGYIMKEEATEELLNAINTVLRGELYVSKRLSALVLKRFFRGDTSSNIAEKLSDRELQVFQFLGSGLTAQEIAQQLHLSVKTVETHRENIKHKLELRDAAGVVQAAREWVTSTER